VRMTERHLKGDPPTGEEVARVEADVAEALDRSAAAVPWPTATSLIGVAGTVTTIVAIARGLTAYDPAVIHGLSASHEEVEDVTARLLSMDRLARAQLPVMHPGRVDVIAGGAIVLRAIVRRSGGTVIASETDILDGVARTLADVRL
jgi:exopolyphosphatase / guanosine-5'-triphosphate,3'-diphosphate pyrophosphatase